MSEQEDKSTPTPESETSTHAPIINDETAKYRSMAERYKSQRDAEREQLAELRAWKAEREAAEAEAAAKAGDTEKLAAMVNAQDAQLKEALAKVEAYEAERAARQAKLTEQADAAFKALPPAVAERWGKHLDGLDPERKLGILQDLKAAQQTTDPGQPGGAPAAGGNGEADGISDAPQWLLRKLEAEGRPRKDWPKWVAVWRENHARLAKGRGGEA